MIENLNEIKVFLINKYLNIDYKIDDTTTHIVNGEKIEYFYINNLIFKSIEKSLIMFEPLLLLGTTQEIENKLNKYKNVVEKWNINEAKRNSKEIDYFVKDYNIDTNEIDNIILKLINDNLNYREVA